MVYPNSFCLAFCNWMLNISWQQLTPSRLALITTVYNAAVTGTSVTSLQYSNFTQVSAWRLPFYEAFLKSQLPYSAPPVGVCDFWINPTGLRINNSNSYGSVNNQGQITQLNDILGSSVNGTAASLAKTPNLLHLPYLFNQPNSISINAGSIQFFNLNNALTFTKSITGYTIFFIGSCIASGSVKSAFYFSSGASAGSQRVGIGVNTGGQFIGLASRIDGTAVSTLTGGVATTDLQIVAFTVNYTTGAGAIYQNGALTNSNASLVTTGSTSNTNSMAAQIGTLNGGSQWNGLILDSLAFQTALSAVNILTLSTWLNSLRNIY